MLGWTFFELSGGQDFQPVLAAPVSEVAAPTDDADPIDRSFDREEVARAETTLCAVLNLMMTQRMCHTSMFQRVPLCGKSALIQKPARLSKIC